MSVFKDIIGLEIQYLGGGYFHPSMFDDGRLNPQYRTLYGKSGETMFDIDRVNGGTINTSEAGRKFWALIDQAGAAKNWPWNYGGGHLAPQLKELAAQMIEPLYNQLCTVYLSEKARAIVAGNRKLLFHFVYATFNGAGWFNYFATILNTEIAKGNTDGDKLADVITTARLNSNVYLIKDGGVKISNLFKDAFFL